MLELEIRGAQFPFAGVSILRHQLDRGAARRDRGDEDRTHKEQLQPTIDYFMTRGQDSRRKK
jgi:hypothetical protein